MEDLPVFMMCFMDNVNYREWADYIIETLAQDGIRDGLVLELGMWNRYCDRDACRCRI